jgi:hypothetical protein
VREGKERGRVRKKREGRVRVGEQGWGADVVVEEDLGVGGERGGGRGDGGIQAADLKCMGGMS